MLEINIIYGNLILIDVITLYLATLFSENNNKAAKSSQRGELLDQHQAIILAACLLL